jgi:hypothetical protein
MTKGTNTWQEIFSQPKAWKATLETFAADRAALEGFLDQVEFDQILVAGRVRPRSDAAPGCLALWDDDGDAVGAGPVPRARRRAGPGGHLLSREPAGPTGRFRAGRPGCAGTVCRTDPLLHQHAPAHPGFGGHTGRGRGDGGTPRPASRCVGEHGGAGGRPAATTRRCSRPKRCLYRMQRPTTR